MNGKQSLSNRFYDNKKHMFGIDDIFNGKCLKFGENIVGFTIKLAQNSSSL